MTVLISFKQKVYFSFLRNLVVKIHNSVLTFQRDKEEEEDDSEGSLADFIDDDSTPDVSPKCSPKTFS